VNSSKLLAQGAEKSVEHASKARSNNFSEMGSQVGGSTRTRQKILRLRDRAGLTKGVLKPSIFKHNIANNTNVKR
jgi:hypothetical protein